VNQLNLADLYQTANISLSAEDFSARQTAFASFGKALKESQVVDLVRLYFALGDPATGSDWFRDGIASTDSRFSLAAHKREGAVLAGGLLFTSLSEGHSFPGLAVLAASIGGKRLPSVPGIDIASFETSLSNLAARKLKSQIYSTGFKPLGKTTVTKETLSTAASVPALGDSVFLSNEESHNATKLALIELQNIVKRVGDDLGEAREEIAMLWWLIGGWSRSLKRSFAEIGTPLSAVSAGFDLADLSIRVHGPYAAEAMFARVLSGAKKQKKNTASFAEVGDAANADVCNELRLSDETAHYADICPLSNSLAKSSEIGKGTAWHQSFVRTSHVEVTLQMSPVEIAMQAMRERLFLGNL
jgi:hypothetical protein